MAKKKLTEKGFWIPINIWNLNELFTSESISPISFYKERSFGNSVNRNQEEIEDENNLILFDDAIKSEVLLNISPELLDLNYLKEIKSEKRTGLKSFKYSKTIYLKNDLFKVYFSSQKKLNEFLNNSFMLLEVKAVNKYKENFVVKETYSKRKAFYQLQFNSERNEIQPFFDKAYNQFKGLIYGYLIELIGSFDEKEQGLISDLSKLKNIIGTVHTDIVLSEQYSNLWLINIRKQINDCQKSYVSNFEKQSDVFSTLILRLEEIDNLNRMRCSDLTKQKTPSYRRNYEIEQENLERAKQKLYKYECAYEITPLKEELEQLKAEEESWGKIVGKTRKYYAKGTDKYNRKKELKQLITEFENGYEYKELKKDVETQKEKAAKYQFGFTQYDTSITEQFNRVSEHLHEITKKTTTYFRSKNSMTNDFPDISFEIDIVKLTNYYFNQSKGYTDFSIAFPKVLVEKLTKTELNLLTVSINSILSLPQGQLGNFSELTILEIIKRIGEHLPENAEKQTLRNYYLYRVGSNDSFKFPENQVLANLIVFLMKHGGHEQINKMLIAKNISNRQIAFLFYGAYIGFANMPKTFTNVIFDSDNFELLNYIDDCLTKKYSQI
ncbi:hypothetical protein LJC16_00375 [Bacteroidales bacterium OttesenSCG-928-C19]|nr:hypothetical protein [Bacteroidales bacterium OttesenSCG-928-C19]